MKHETITKTPAADSFITYPISGIDCADCAGRLERALLKDESLQASSINFAAARISIPAAETERAQAIIDRVEPGVVIETTPERRESAAEVNAGTGHRRLIRILTALALMAAGIGFNGFLSATPFGWAEYAVFLSAYFLIGWPVLSAAVRNISRGLIFDENFLMTLATLGAIAIHELPEAVGVMLFYAVGEYFQNRAVDNSRRSVTALLEARPDKANLKTSAGVELVRPAEVPVGAEILVRPGERIPLDGVIIEGGASLDTSALTGESVPRPGRPGYEVLAGMVCLDSLLTVKVTRPESESSIARILTLVEDAAGRKAPTEKFITTFARYYTPVVVFTALAIALIPPLFMQGALFSDWFYRALTILVISCPCALVVSIPLGYFGGLGGASRQGILIKGANFLEALTDIRTAALDKTGTVTLGSFEVVEIGSTDGTTPEELLELAAAAEAHSSHPIAAAIRRACTVPPDETQLTDYREISGRGIIARYRGRELLVGNSRLLEEQGIPVSSPPDGSSPATRLFIAADGRMIGTIAIADGLKPGVAQTVRELKELGVERVVMVTGDIASTAAAVAAEAGIDSWFADLLPEDKVTTIETLDDESGGRLLFAGDGLNDAPVLARADVGVAMGGLGSDAAIEAADVIIMDDDPAKIVTAIRIARRTRKIVYQNIVLAIGIKLIFLSMGTLGAVSMWEAVIADVGVALLAILNATRALRTAR